MIQPRLLLNPTSSPGLGESKTTFTAKTVSGPREAPESVKGKEFTLDTSLMENSPAGEIKPDAVKITPSTPLEFANSLIKDTPVESTDTKTPVVTKPETAKAEPTDKTPVEVKVADAPEFKPIAPKSKGETKEFDYTGFSQEESNALRQMSTGARDFAIKILKDNKELSAHKGGQFMQHPQAYTLDPQFNAIQEDAYYANKEAAYWQDQLAKVKSGEKWQPITGWDKSGNPVLGAEQIPTTQAEEQIRLMMNRCYQSSEVKQQELQQFVGTYQQRVRQDSSAIQAERTKRFGWVGNPEILKETVILDNGTEQSVGDIRKTLISLFPPYMQNTQGVEVAADLFAAIQIYGQELRELRSGQKTQEIKTQEVTRAEPKSTLGGGKSNAPKEFTLSGMPI